jgi:uncharacterized protein (DUF697 family)
LFRWQTIDLSGHGTILVLDARGVHSAKFSDIEQELKEEPADVFIHLSEADQITRSAGDELDNLVKLYNFNSAQRQETKVVGIILGGSALGRRAAREETVNRESKDPRVLLESAMAEMPPLRENLLQIFEISVEVGGGNADANTTGAQAFMSLLARQLPNEARVEMVRIARDRAAQIEIAQLLVKSTTAICTAIGAQPIPLADLPVLTTLQLVMVSGIMYISGRERSLRAATEFIGAMGVNVGAGMIFREGARALLKFFPGWGNVVCGMVAGAGTYAVGRSAIVYFLEGVSLKDARRIYLANRRRQSQKKPKELNVRAE